MTAADGREAAGRVGRARDLALLAISALAAVVATDAWPEPLGVPLLAPFGAALVTLLVALRFRRRGPGLFSPALFFLILSLTLFVLRNPSFWLPNLALALGTWGALTSAARRPFVDWLKAGRADGASVTGALGLAVVSAGALFLWEGATEPDMTLYVENVPRVGSLLLIAGVAGFSLFNAAAEELVFRGILWGGFEKILMTVETDGGRERRVRGGGAAVIIAVQAVVFGLSHLKGVPSGATGVGLATLYGAALGFLRLKTNGLLVPFFAHVITDVAVALVVLTAIGRV